MLLWVNRKGYVVTIFSSYLKKKTLNIKNMPWRIFRKLQSEKYQATCHQNVSYSYHLIFPTIFHHKLFSKGESHPVQSVGTNMTKDSLQQPSFIYFSSSKTFNINLRSNLKERNSLSRYAKYVIVAIIALIYRFWCIRAVLIGFSQPSSNAVAVCSCKSSNLHSVKLCPG